MVGSKKNLGIRVALFVIAGAFIVVLSAAGAVRPMRNWVLGAGVAAFDRAHRAAAWIRDVVGGGKTRIGALERERAELLARIGRLEALRQENETLRAALSLRDEGEAGALPATVVGFLREGRDEFLLLDKGTRDGIGVGDLVVDRHRVLGGTVVSVGPRFARVILLTSASRSTDILLPASDLRAIARGNNAGELIIDLVPRDAEVSVGDLVIASPRATGGRRSLVVGEIREVKKAEHEVFKSVRAVQLFDPFGDDVLVLLAP